MRRFFIFGLMALMGLVTNPVEVVSAGESEYEVELGKRVEKYGIETFEFTRKHSEQGDKTARCNLSFYYAIGLFVKQDYGVVAKIYSELNDEDCPYASPLKGLMYRDGLGVKKDFEKSKFWFRRTVLRMGYLKIEDSFLPEGADIKAEIEEAQAWHTRLFKNADPQTQYKEALKYLSGDGVIADPLVARELLSKSVKAEIPEAMYQLGRGYLNGIFKKDGAHASRGLYWMSLAARKGVIAAQKAMAIWHATHATRQRDNLNAYFWLRHAKLTEADLGPLVAEIIRRVSDTEKRIVESMLERDSYP